MTLCGFTHNQRKRLRRRRNESNWKCHRIRVGVANGFCRLTRFDSEFPFLSAVNGHQNRVAARHGLIHFHFGLMKLPVFAFASRVALGHERVKLQLVEIALYSWGLASQLAAHFKIVSVIEIRATDNSTQSKYLESWDVVQSASKALTWEVIKLAKKLWSFTFKAIAKASFNKHERKKK